MAPLTMESLASLLRVQDWPMSIWVLLLTALAVFAAQYARPPAFPAKAPAPYKGPGVWPVIGALRFFHQRANFIQDGMHASPTGNFSFWWGKLKIVSVSGAEGRKFFFESPEKNLSMTKG
jgi:hypothetical protein